MFSATNLHAMIIHFPIALILVGFVFEIIGVFSNKLFFKNIAFYLLLIGVLGTITAYISGSYAGEGIEVGALQLPIELHEQAAVISLYLAIITALFKLVVFYFKYDSKEINWIGFILFAVLTFSVVGTCYLGGELVYSYGAGVEL